MVEQPESNLNEVLKLVKVQVFLLGVLKYPHVEIFSYSSGYNSWDKSKILFILNMFSVFPIPQIDDWCRYNRFIPRFLVIE